MKDFLKLVVFAGLFAVPFLTLYVENDYFFPFITGKNFGFRIIVDIVFAAWVLLALYDAQYRPKFSWIFAAFGGLLVVMFFANFFGEHPRSSFWSNFERMDGYVSLVHTFMYALVAGSVLTKKEHWVKLFNTSLGVATVVVLIGLAQYLGNESFPRAFNATIGANRVDSTLGNAAYMAVYTLFHVFIMAWLFINTKRPWLKYVYAALAVLFIFVLAETGTRGTAVGLAAGAGVATTYIALFGAAFPKVQQAARWGLLALVVVILGFIGARDSEFVQGQKNLARIANISIDDLTVRGTIWGMAWEGAQERPVLGWGQSNFNYVFNEQYEPSLYAQEQWFDRSHNIVFDWLIAGGFLGLIAYSSIFLAAAYYLLWRPFFKNDERFTVLERGILLGLLAGYLTHNFVVFDNIISYIFFALILGLIHARVGTPIKAIDKKKVDQTIITQAAAPVMAAALIATFYFAHMPSMGAAGDIIDGFRLQDPAQRFEEFASALDRGSFAHQEITEQLAQQTMNFTRNPQVPQEVKDQYRTRTKEELDKLVAQKPGDARVHVFVGSYYRAIGDLTGAAEQMAMAREFSPDKQTIIIQQGLVALAQNDQAASRDFMKEAYELDQSNLQAREYYAAASFQVGDIAAGSSLLTDDQRVLERFADSDFLLSAANQAGATDFLITLYENRITRNPAEAQNWATLAFLQYQNDDNAAALATLTKGGEEIPTFAPTATCIASNIKAGREPQEGCAQ